MDCIDVSYSCFMLITTVYIVCVHLTFTLKYKEEMIMHNDFFTSATAASLVLFGNLIAW